jgi:hypothetical protein
MVHSPGDHPKGKQCEVLTHVLWWTALTISLLGLCAFGLVAYSSVPVGPIGKLLVLFLTCWLCAFLCLRMKDEPRMSVMIQGAKKERYYEDTH